MGTTNAYCCDGPGCEQLTTKPPNHQWPPQWDRLALTGGHAKGELERPKAGSFHAPMCAVAWVAEQLALQAETVEPEPAAGNLEQPDAVVTTNSGPNLGERLRSENEVPDAVDAPDLAAALERSLGPD